MHYHNTTFAAAFFIGSLVSCNERDTTTTAAAANDSITLQKGRAPEAATWKGRWHRSNWQNEGSLDIAHVINDSIVFELDASSGGHIGNVAGKALIKGKKAVYSQTEEYDNCVLNFELLGDSVITIDQVSGNCFAGMGVVYSGRYYNIKYKPADQEPKETLETIGLLNAREDAAFKELTGKDYELFVNSTQLRSDAEDMDSLHVKVYASGIRGLFTQMENIIMIDDDLHIWAAVLDDEKVYYYTNADAYRKTLPKTIEHWRERFADYPVSYKSVK